MTGFVSFIHENSSFLAAGMLLTLTSSFGQTFFISVFAGEIMQAFGLSDGEWGLIYASGTMASAGLLLWAGALTDRYRARIIGVIILAALAVSCLFMAVNTSAALLPFAIFLLRFTGQGMATHIAITAMARWFVASRGKALAVAGTGHAIGEALLPICFVWALTFADWRFLWVIAGIMALATTPVLAKLLKKERTPRALAVSSERTGMEGRHWRRSDMLRHPLFYSLLPLLLGPPAFVTALFFQQVHLSEVKGWTHVGFVALIPLFTVTAIAANIGSGWLIDRLGARRLIAFYQIPHAMGFAVLAAADTLWLAGLAMGLIGVSSGANATLPAAFWAESYGTRHIGGIKSITAATMVFGSALGPAITGLLIDTGMNFPAQMWLIACWFLIASILAGFALARFARTSAAPS